MINLTNKEKNALKAILDNALQAMGGSSAQDLLEDNFSWFNASDIAGRADLDINQAKGLISSLAEKGLVSSDGGLWFLTMEGIICAGNNEVTV